MIRHASSVSLSLLVYLAAAPATADILLVHADGTGTFPTIQAAVDAAVDGDEVHLVAGTYTGEGNRDVNFQGKAITVRSQSGDAASVTIAPWVDSFTIARAFILDSGESPSSVLEFLTISQGFDDFFGSSPAGIVLCLGSSPTIRHCVFTQNQGTCLSSVGGAPSISECAFIDNFAATHGAVGIEASSAILVSDCLFEGNSATEDVAGAAGVYGGTVRRCTFRANYAYHSAGALYVGTGTLVEACTFEGNQVTAYGGGAIASSGSTIRDCSFVSNTAFVGGSILANCGGASPSPTVVEGCTFVDFGSWNDAAIKVTYPCVFELSRCILAFGRNSDPGSDYAPIEIDIGAPVAITCTNIFGNAHGDWVGPLAPFLGVDGNISVDPLFCDAAEGDFTLYGSSPCAPANSGGCGLIGVYPVGCGPVSVEAKSWGEIKGMYK